MKYVRGMGKHIMTTLVNCQLDVLTNGEILKGWLKKFPPKIGMSLIEVPDNPMLYSCYSLKNPDNYGFSGFVLLHESHCSIHAWPIELTLDIDVFSCYDFDTDKTLNMICEFFGGNPINTSIVDRGHGLRSD